MITKNTITPWYQPQLQSFRINYFENLLEFDHLNKDKEGIEINLPKKHRSLNTLEPKPKTSIRNVLGFQKYRTLEKKERHSEYSKKERNFFRKEESLIASSNKVEKEKAKHRVFLRERKIWFSKRMSL